MKPGGAPPGPGPALPLGPRGGAPEHCPTPRAPQACRPSSLPQLGPELPPPVGEAVRGPSPRHPGLCAWAPAQRGPGREEGLGRVGWAVRVSRGGGRGQGTRPWGLRTRGWGPGVGEAAPWGRWHWGAREVCRVRVSGAGVVRSRGGAAGVSAPEAPVSREQQRAGPCRQGTRCGQSPRGRLGLRLPGVCLSGWEPQVHGPSGGFCGGATASTRALSASDSVPSSRPGQPLAPPGASPRPDP